MFDKMNLRFQVIMFFDNRLKSKADRILKCEVDRMMSFLSIIRFYNFGGKTSL